jgi:hypothetical protein
MRHSVDAIGYASRAIATHQSGSLVPFLLQAIFLLLPPCLFAATLYMVYARLVRGVHGEQFSLIPPRWCTRIFVIGDLLCLNIQSTGAGFLPKLKMRVAGNCIVIAGLALQILIFAGFMWCCLLFHKRFRGQLAAQRRTVDLRWEPTVWMLYGTSIFISSRNIFRLVEFVTGDDGGYLFHNEWPIYVFDGALMLLVMIGFYIWYPSTVSIIATNSAIELTSCGDLPEGNGREDK